MTTERDSAIVLAVRMREIFSLVASDEDLVGWSDNELLDSYVEIEGCLARANAAANARSQRLDAGAQRRQLDLVVWLAGQLRVALEPVEVRKSLCDAEVELWGEFRDPDLIPHDLRLHIQALDRLVESADKASQQTRASPTPNRRGRPPKPTATAVATAARKLYEGLSGKRATVTRSLSGDSWRATGPFVELVRLFFEAEKIEASPEVYARRVTAPETAAREKNPAREPQ